MSSIMIEVVLKPHIRIAINRMYTAEYLSRKYIYIKRNNYMTNMNISSRLSYEFEFAANNVPMQFDDRKSPLIMYI